MRTFVIGEMGVTHNGDLRHALNGIDDAKAAGCDAVKTQWWSSPNMLAARRGQNDASVYERYKFPREWLPMLRHHCDRVGIEFMCTAFLISDLHEILPFVHRLKISHAEADWKEFVYANCEIALPLIISVVPGRNVAARPYMRIWNLLTCSPKYPTPLEGSNIEHIKHTHGYSDHTKDIMMGAFAVAAGARIVEVHFQAYHDPRNPDFYVAHDPISLRNYVRNLRHAERAFGEGWEAPTMPAQPQSFPHTSRPPALAASDLSADLRAGSFGVRWQELPPQEPKNSQPGGPRV